MTPYSNRSFLWGTAEMFYEGWWGPWSVRVPYLVPGGSCLALSVIALASPLVGGWLLVGIGGAFTLWWWSRVFRTGISVVLFLSLLPVSGFMALAGPRWSEGLVPGGGGQDPRHGFPSWDQIALYSLAPVGFGPKPA